jgi:hypothetical protein
MFDMQQQLHDFWLETPNVIEKTWRDMETPEEMLIEFMLEDIVIIRNLRAKIKEIWKQ